MSTNGVVIGATPNTKNPKKVHLEIHTSKGHAGFTERDADRVHEAIEVLGAEEFCRLFNVAYKHVVLNNAGVDADRKPKAGFAFKAE